MSLRDRILARLALAEAATPGPWHITKNVVGSSITVAWAADEWVDEGEKVVADWMDDADAAFIADRDPAAVIRECRADLALLDWIDSTTVHGPRTLEARTNLHARYPEGDA